MALEHEGSCSTGVPLLDQPFILINVWNNLDAADKKALRQVCKPLRLAVDEQVTSLALLDNDPFFQPPAQPSFFKAAGQRWPNLKSIALRRMVNVQTLLSPNKYGVYGGHAPFPRLQALTVMLDGCSPTQLATLATMAAPWLTRLTIVECNSVVDLSPLAACTGLRLLSVRNHFASDLSPLSCLRELRRLDLRGSPLISDLRPLSGLMQLTHLDLTLSPVSDLSPLEGLDLLETLSLNFCSLVSELGPLALRHPRLRNLDLSSTAVTELSGLVGATGLEYVDASFTAVSDVAPLAGCTQMRHLGVMGCKHLTSLAPLSGWTQLRTLRLGGCPVASPEGLKPLRGCTALRCQPKVPSFPGWDGLGAWDWLEVPLFDEGA